MKKLKDILNGSVKIVTIINDADEYNYKPLVGDTDGFNFQMPEKFRYTEDNPYVSKGLGRNYPKGKSYTGVDADVAEFEDLYLNEEYATGPNKMGLGIDEYVPASINFSRKNYADLLDEETGEVKLVGNTIKSKKMPIYIEKFLNKGISYLLAGKGKKFLDMYYDYIDDIYNLRIPLKDIASIGKIKTSIEDYKKSCQTVTKSGSKKARQAWYELAIKENLDVNMGDSIYYINTGKKKNDSDVQRLTKYFNSKGEDVTKDLEKEYNKVKKETDPTKKGGESNSYNGKSVWHSGGTCDSLKDFIKKYYPSVEEKDELIFNCVLLPNNIIDDEDDHFCNDSFEYNVVKYIEQFNKRIKPLLVCFSKNIRTRIDSKGKEVDNILITNPQDRKEFTEEESKLTSGEPYNECDQDTYEALMTMEDKEIAFWLSQNKVPLFVKECGMDWDDIVEKYNKRLEVLQKTEVIEERKKIISIIEKMTMENFVESKYPESFYKIVYQDINEGGFKSIKYDVMLLTYSEVLEIKMASEDIVE